MNNNSANNTNLQVPPSGEFKGASSGRSGRALRFIVSGGGTGGHIFPAVSIANALKARFPDAEFLFVGALGRMEMERVPQAGYHIEGLPVKGFDRKNMLKNVAVLRDLFKSIRQAKNIIKRFKPDIAIGVGGYASAPTLRAATKFGVPTLLQEQNSYAGVTNKLLAKKASTICVAYDAMERFFPKDKIVKTGNPVRQDLFNVAPKAKEAYEFFGLDPNKKTLLIVGGSLGARTINQSVATHLSDLNSSNIQVIWQTGKGVPSNSPEGLAPPDLPKGEEMELASSPKLAVEASDVEKSTLRGDLGGLLRTEFVSRMDYAYAIADLVISRAGASSISELCLLAKPVILVPSPNVSEDHQTQNALALVNKGAALMIRDAEAVEKLIPEALQLINNEKQLKQLSENVLSLAEKNSAERIVDEIVKVLKTA